MGARVNSSLAMRGSNHQSYRHCNNDDSSHISYKYSLYVTAARKLVVSFISLWICYELLRCYDVYHITHHYSLDCNSHYNPLGSGSIQQTL